MNGEVGVGLARKGVGRLKIFDHDTVELSNLNRQRFWEADLYQNKAERLAKNLAKEATAKSLFVGCPMTFQDAVESGIDITGEVVVCGVDNNETRVFVARHFLKTAPVIFIAVSNDAEHGYVFVQEPGKTCYGCLFPDSVNDPRRHLY